MKKNKKKIIVIMVLFFLILLPIIIFLTDKHIHRLEPVNGKYYIVENQKYTDAYIKVYNDSAIFVNIDLNDLFLKEYANDYISTLENKSGEKLSAKEKREIVESIDLNKLFCKNEFKLDYKSYKMRYSKTICAYRLGQIIPHSYLAYKYDYENKTILLSSAKRSILFELKKSN